MSNFLKLDLVNPILLNGKQKNDIHNKIKLFSQEISFFMNYFEKEYDFIYKNFPGTQKMWKSQIDNLRY